MAYGDCIAALGDPTRRTCSSSCGEGPRSVGDLAARAPCQPARGLAAPQVLKDAGLVRDAATGRATSTASNGDGLAELREYFDGFWDEALAAFKAAAESEGGRRRG